MKEENNVTASYFIATPSGTRVGGGDTSAEKTKCNMSTFWVITLKTGYVTTLRALGGCHEA